MLRAAHPQLDVSLFLYCGQRVAFGLLGWKRDRAARRLAPEPASVQESVNSQALLATSQTY